MRTLLIAATLLCLTCPGTAAAQSPAAGLVKGLEALDAKLEGSLSASKRAAVHKDKAKLIAAYFDGRARGVRFSDVLSDLDCLATSIQRAREASRSSARKLIAKGKLCLQKLAEKLVAGGEASASLRKDLGKIASGVAAIASLQKKGKAYGNKATALRKTAVSFVKKHFDRDAVGGVSFAQAYADLECIDVKVESGAISGASSCAKRLRRLLRANLPKSEGGTSPDPSGPPITFGSDLSGDPVAIAGKYPEDNAWWTQGLTVPKDGRVTAFKLRTGANPVALPIRFTVVRPQPGGRVQVVTTTDPPYDLPAGTPGTYSFSTSTLSFKCCNVKQGDIVTVSQRGADQTQDPYVWFARKPGVTTYSFVSTTPGARALDPGAVWTPTLHDGYDVLLQAVVSPS